MIATEEKINETVLTREIVARMVADFDKPRTAAELRNRKKANDRWLLHLLARYARHMEMTPEAFINDLKHSSLLSPDYKKALVRYVRRYGIPQVPELTVDDIADGNWLDAAGEAHG